MYFCCQCGLETKCHDVCLQSANGKWHVSESEGQTQFSTEEISRRLGQGWEEIRALLQIKSKITIPCTICIYLSVCPAFLVVKTVDRITTKSVIDPGSISWLCTNVHFEKSSMQNDLLRQEEIRAALFTEAHNDSVSKYLSPRLPSSVTVCLLIFTLPLDIGCQSPSLARRT